MNFIISKKAIYLVLTAFVFIFMAGCKKNKEFDLRPNLNVSNDQILANRPFIYAFQILLRAATDSTLQSTLHAEIDGATVNLDVKRQTYTFLFQDTMSSDSVRRGGAFVATVDSGFFHKGTTMKIVFQGYAEDGHVVSGKDSIRCNGLLNDDYLYDNFISEARITKDSAHNIQFRADYKMSVSRIPVTYGTNQRGLTFAGNSGGISSGGYPFTSSIENALIFRQMCPWICDGLIAFSITGADIPSGTIEFMAKIDCNDNIKYDFTGNIYLLRMMNKFLLD
jgi:hypothetical protein